MVYKQNTTYKFKSTLKQSEKADKQIEKTIQERNARM